MVPAADLSESNHGTGRHAPLVRARVRRLQRLRVELCRFASSHGCNADEWERFSDAIS